MDQAVSDAREAKQNATATVDGLRSYLAAADQRHAKLLERLEAGRDRVNTRMWTASQQNVPDPAAMAKLANERATVLSLIRNAKAVQADRSSEIQQQIRAAEGV